MGRISTNSEVDAFFRNLAETAQNLILNEQSVIEGKLKQAIKDASGDGKETAEVKASVVMVISGPEMMCKPYIETVRQDKTRNTAEVVTSDTTPDMFNKNPAA